MFITIGTFLAGLVGKGVTERTAKVLGIGALAVGAILAFLIWLAIHDANVADDALDEQDAAINAAVIGADRYAGERKDERDSDFANSQSDVSQAINNAVRNDPAAASKPVGPASQSYYDELRRQREKKQ